MKMDNKQFGLSEAMELEHKYRFHIDKLRASFEDVPVNFVHSGPGSCGFIITFEDTGSEAFPLEKRYDGVPSHLIRYSRCIGWKGWRPYFYNKRTTPPQWITKETSMAQLIEIIERIKADRTKRGL